LDFQQTSVAADACDLTSLVALAPDGIFVADAAGRFSYVNSAGCALLGLSRDELLGLSITDVVDPDASLGLDDDRRQMLAGASIRRHWRLRHSGGRWVDVEVTANVAPGGQWQCFVRGLEGTRREDARRRELLEQAQRDRAWLQAVAARLPVGMALFQHGGRASFNPKAMQLLGLEPGEESGTSSRDYACRLFHPDGRPLRVEEFPSLRALSGDASAAHPTHYIIRGKDGAETPVLASAAPLHDDHGGMLGAVVILQDLTDVADLKRAVHEKEELLQAVFDLLPVGVYVADRNGRIMLGNPSGERIWEGCRDADLAHYGEYKGWRVDTGEPLAAEDWGLARALRTGETSRGELLRIQCFDGKQKTVINWAAPLRSESGEITGGVAVNEDVTALHRIQEQLHAAVQDRENILAVVAHDLRSPLSSLGLRAAILERTARAMPGGESLARGAAAMAATTQQMAALVDDLLDVSVHHRGRSRLELAALPAHEVVGHAADAAEPLYAAAGLKLVVERRTDLPDVAVDARRMERVFANLLDNALKFTEPDGSVTLGARACEEGVVFTVANTGPALTGEDVQRIFQPFWLARKDRRGAGLGMSICRSIVEAHGGTISVQAADGMRVEIRVVLPGAGAR
jgi:PAS domain S-box-containing protein